MGSADLVVGEISRRNAKVLVKHATLVARPVRDDASSGGFSDAAAAPDCSCRLWLAARCARAPRRSSKKATASLKHTRFGRAPRARLGSPTPNRDLEAPRHCEESRRQIQLDRRTRKAWSSQSRETPIYLLS